MHPIDQLIEILEHQKLAGTKSIPLSKSSREFLFAAKPAARPTAAAARNPVRSSSPPAVPRTEEIPLESLLSRVPPMTENLQVPLSAVKDIVSVCRRCGLCADRARTVFGDGNPGATLMFIGDGPSRADESQGIPFADEAGLLLNKMIAAMQFRREDVYVTNVIKCYAPGVQGPSDMDALTCLPYLQREIELVQPKVLVLLGPTPLFCLFHKRNIAKHRGIWLQYRDIDCMPTYRPAYLLRKPEAKREAWNDLQQVMKRLGKKPA